MKRLEKDSKTMLFVPGQVATTCTSHFEEECIGVENILYKVLLFHYYFLYHILSRNYLTK